MKNINTASPEIRDNLLKLNIGKYNQITSDLILPIGHSYNIYEGVPNIKTSNLPNGLLGFINDKQEEGFINKLGELEVNATIPNSFIRGDVPVDITYVNTDSQKYSYIDGYTYNDPVDKNWWKLGINAAVSYINGDSLGFNVNNGKIGLASAPIEITTTLASRLVNIAFKDTELAKTGMVALSSQLANTVALKSRMTETVNEFFKKPVDFFDAIDKLDFSDLSNAPSTGFLNGISKLIPIYFYSEVKDEKNTNGLSWVNEVGYKTSGDIYYDRVDGVDFYSGSNSVLIDDNGLTVDISTISSSQQSLLNKTKKLFQSGKIETMISQVGRISSKVDKSISADNRLSKGRNLKPKYGNGFLRTWTSTNQYDKLSSLIQPFSPNQVDKLNQTLKSVRPGFDSLEKYGVLQDNGFVKITPYSDDKYKNGDQREVKKYMFSIENLAWKDNIDLFLEGTSQEGPNGGRIMWFPPYDISFNETTSVQWNSDTFIGRGEPVYTYSNTERGGTINFKIIVDHPSIINYYKRDGVDISGSPIENDDYLRFFSGDDVLRLKDDIESVTDEKPKARPVNTNPSKTYKFKVFFPNNYSGVKDDDAIDYLMFGNLCGIGGNGYENDYGNNIIVSGLSVNDWKGLTPYNSTACNGNYFYRVDSIQVLAGGANGYKDTRSFGLNATASGDSDILSFREVYQFIENPKLTDGSDLNNDFYETLKNANSISISASSSKQGDAALNDQLTQNRGNTIKKWLQKVNNKDSVYGNIISLNSKASYKGLDVNSRDAKLDRFVYVVITTSPEQIDLNNDTNLNDYKPVKIETEKIEKDTNNSTHFRVRKSMYGYYNDNKNNEETRLKNDEAKFFNKIEGSSIRDIINGELSKKIQYFHPAFHSSTPEGFNSRLTFLHQCTRQGPTLEASGRSEKRSSTNMSFGRPPICILRIGDFYNTKVIFESLNIDFDPLVWDLNKEGVGVQPMIASISMNFKFIGGSDLTGPIARLQNAITFNFFANTGVYDDRNDRITAHTLSGDTYDRQYNPGVYGNNTKNDTIVVESSENTARSNSKEEVKWETDNYIYELISTGPKRHIIVRDKITKIIKFEGLPSYTATNRELFIEAKMNNNDN